MEKENTTYYQRIQQEGAVACDKHIEELYNGQNKSIIPIVQSLNAY